MKYIVTVIFFTLFISVRVYGSDDYTELSSYDFTEIQEILDEENNLNFEDTVRMIMSGDLSEKYGSVGELILNVFFSELTAEKKLVVKILIIGLAAAVFSNISGAVLSGKISGTGFYITYISLISALTAGYGIMADMITETMERLTELMNAIVPVYTLSVGFSAGQASAGGFYRIIVIIISIIEKILLRFVIPVIYVYMIVNIINNIADGRMFTKACELIRSLAEWLLKGLMSFVIGINLIQSLINPIVDSLKTGTLGKVLSGIPGIGGTLNSVSGIIFASGSLIKNAIGMGGVAAVLTVCFMPVVKILAVSLIYKGTGAVLEPVSDKRVVNCINGTYTSLVLLMRTLLYAVVFFVLTIAIICSSTNYHSL